MPKKTECFFKNLSLYLAFSYCHKYCPTLTKNSDEILNPAQFIETVTPTVTSTGRHLLYAL